MLDIVFALAHHVAAFTLIGLMFVKFTLITMEVDTRVVRRLAAVDKLSGMAAVLALIVGFSRAIFAAKGWDYYSHNGAFWAKVAVFVVISLITIHPTLLFIRWTKRPESMTEAGVRSVRRGASIELALSVFLLLFAVLMARGAWQF